VSVVAYGFTNLVFQVMNDDDDATNAGRKKVQETRQRTTTRHGHEGFGDRLCERT
jgi:hypothetical protein